MDKKCSGKRAKMLQNEDNRKKGKKGDMNEWMKEVRQGERMFNRNDGRKTGRKAGRKEAGETLKNLGRTLLKVLKE